MLESIFSFPCLDLGTPTIWILYATNVICRRSTNSLCIKCSSWLHSPHILAAAKQHSCRAYHQVKQWINEQKDPLKWGWKTIGGYLRPITSTHPAAPEDLLSLIFCTCKDECVQNCECRRSGLNCLNMCGNCSGLGCVNRDTLIIDHDLDDDLQLDEDQEDFLPPD
ncbi:hypothetical protein AVEN_199705-1 [Araneus ventricosus]|uniref:Tesmin/TSO1-like CXC domain-containing protein n=1 Tax=Araneus ventricosus TaxID=182803 RepID=A0A4Y2GW36_ARAVE|nr:hypothetical protein AVEN_199705-1 [Araneus ventricosus]